MTHYTIEKRGMKGFITPPPQGQLLATLNKQCSFEKQGKQFMANPAWALVRLYNWQKHSFPWGLIKRIQRICEQDAVTNGNTYTITGHQNITLATTHNPKTRDYQRRAIETLAQNGGGVLSMPTGSGKTFTALEFLRLTNLRATVVVHTLDLKKQWEREAAKLGVGVNVITYQSKLAEQYIKLHKVVIFDECHHVAAKSIYQLAGKCLSWQMLIGLSATPYREDGLDMIIEAVLGPTLFTVTRRELIDSGVLCNAVVYYVPTLFEPSFYQSYTEEYQTHIVENNKRNWDIARVADSLALSGKRVLVLVNIIEHGETLHKLLKGFGHKTVFVHGKSVDRSIGDAQIIVASQIFNEGVDFPELDALVLAGSGKSGIKVTQQVGRVLRQRPNKEKAVVVDFVDETKYLARHYRARRKRLEQDFEVIDGWPTTANQNSE